MDLESDILVIGGGLAGLVAGITAAQMGFDTIVVRKGQGATADSSGAVDVSGYIQGGGTPFISPIEGTIAYSSLMPFHPYTTIGIKNVGDRFNGDYLVENVRHTIDWVKATLKDPPAELVGQSTSNISALTVIGTWKPTCLVQSTMYSARIGNDDEVLLFAGIKGMPSFNPSAAAKSMISLVMASEVGPRKIVHTLLDVPSICTSPNLSCMEVARKLDTVEGLADFTKALAEQVQKTNSTIVALPPILGTKNPKQIKTHLETEIGVEVFELLAFPPSVPGFRLQRSLEIALRKAGGRLLVGHEAKTYEIKDHKITSIQLNSPRRSISVKPKAIVLATGKFIGGGIEGDVSGLTEPVFGLPVLDGDRISALTVKPQRLTKRTAITNEGHPLFECGIGFDAVLRPLAGNGAPFASNLFAAGSILSGYNYPAEKSGLGVALITGREAGRRASDFAKEVIH